MNYFNQSKEQLIQDRTLFDEYAHNGAYKAVRDRCRVMASFLAGVKVEDINFFDESYVYSVIQSYRDFGKAKIMNAMTVDVRWAHNSDEFQQIIEKFKEEKDLTLERKYRVLKDLYNGKSKKEVINRHMIKKMDTVNKMIKDYQGMVK